MKFMTRLFLSLTVLSLSVSAMSQTASKPATQAPATVASVMDREVSTYEKLMVDVAEAMPEDRYNFTPSSLGIKGGNFEAVRTFSQLIKHTASANYFFWSSLTGDTVPAGAQGPNGSDDLKSKAEIVKILKDSFLLGHKAAATLTADNIVEMVPVGKGQAPRLHLVAFGVIHAADEYGQMVEYLRMNGIIPPASRPK